MVIVPKGQASDIPTALSHFIVGVCKVSKGVGIRWGTSDDVTLDGHVMHFLRPAGSKGRNS